MSALALLAEAQRRGFRLTIEGPNIRVRTGGQKAPPEFIAALRAEKPAVLELLRAANDRAAERTVEAPPLNHWTDPAGALALDDARQVEELERQEALDERIAIAMHDGGVPELWAAALAQLEVSPPPAGLSPAAWREALDMLWRRASEHGEALQHYGWTPDEVFAGDWPWATADKGVKCWTRLDAAVETIDDETIVFATAQGRRWLAARR
jgi:hypothetical protein